MTKEQQNTNWACLPKEAREYIREDYKGFYEHYKKYGSNVHKGAIDTLEDLFGHHNLTSDTEPSEYICVERDLALAHYDRAQRLKDDEDEYWEFVGRQIEHTLLSIFGNKCLPDKEPSVQFNKGDLVKCITDGQIYEVEGKTGKHHYALKGSCYDAHEDNLEPYTEPESRNLSQEIANCDKPIDNQLKDNMEEKELNLCELLKGCEGETFYCSLVDKDVKFKNAFPTGTIYVTYENITIILEDGVDKQGNLLLFPSKEFKSWGKWKESRKQKYVLEIEVSSWFDDEDGRKNEKYDGKKWFKFDSGIELKQAADAVRETLMKIHKDHAEQ